jgi:hypothetical protein
MASNKKTNRKNSGRGDENRMVRALDELSEYEEFKAGILPKLRKMIREGKTAQEIYAFSQSVLAARAVTIGMQSVDEKTALTAIKEILDRGTGRPSESITITSRYEKLSDDALDNMIKQSEAQLEMAEDEDLHH